MEAKDDADDHSVWAAFAASAIDPKVDAFNRMTAQALSQVAPLYTKSIAVARQERADWTRISAVSDAFWLDVPEARSALRVRVLRANSAKAVYLHVHGGGWVLGGADHQDGLLDELRVRAGVSVVSVEYRLAPEHPFPAALDDVEDALRWVLQDGAQSFGTRLVIVGGESAGANLVVSALTRLRGHPAFSGVVAACLHYGTFDLMGTPSLWTAAPGTPFLDPALSKWFREHYAHPDRHRDPEVSPMYADLTGLPPAQFLIGTVDVVRDDTLFMWARWRAAGNRAELVALPGGLHGLLEMRTPLTKLGRERVVSFMRRAVAGE
ncbi:MAG: alpha/beta hydrolase [Myxococcales bacterium]